MDFRAPHVWQSSIVWHRLARSTFDGLRRSELIRLIGQDNMRPPAGSLLLQVMLVVALIRNG